MIELKSMGKFEPKRQRKTKDIEYTFTQQRFSSQIGVFLTWSTKRINSQKEKLEKNYDKRTGNINEKRKKIKGFKDAKLLK